MTHQVLDDVRHEQRDMEARLQGMGLRSSLPHLDRLALMATTVWLIFGTAIAAG